MSRKRKMTNNAHSNTNNGNNSSTNEWVKTVVVPLFTLIGVVVTALVALKSAEAPVVIPIAATQTAESKQTILTSTATIETIPFATNTFLPTSSVTSTYTSTAFPLCPNVKVNHLELFVSTGDWRKYFPGQDGEFDLLLEKEEWGSRANLSGRASLENADDCICEWEGGTQSGPLQAIDSFANCEFSIDLSNTSGQITKIILKLVVGNQPTLFTITKGEIQ